MENVKFDKNGLICAIAQDYETGEVLMQAYMNAEALDATLKTGYAHYYSRSRQKLWKKGEESGHTQKVVSAAFDCDRDCILLQIEQTGAACHTGERSCFHDPVVTSAQGGLTFRLSPQAELKAMVGKGFRNPTIREMYMFTPANDQLEPERLVNYELAYAHRLLGNRLRLGANVFYLKADNIIETVRTGGRPRNVNTGRMENWGLELEAACHVGKALGLSANYSFLSMSHPVVAAPEHKLYMGASYAVGRLSLAAGLQYIGGLYTATEAANGHDCTEDFWLLNLTASLRVARGLRLFARGENLLAQRYEVNYGYPMPRATAMAGVSVEL